MWKNKLNRILNTIMGSVVGIFVGYGIYSVWDYKTYMDLYMMQSAPWYTTLLIYGGYAAAVLILCVILKCVLRKRAEK